MFNDQLESSIHLSDFWSMKLTCINCSKKLDIFKEDVRRKTIQCKNCMHFYEINDRIINFGYSDLFYENHGFTTTGRNFSSSILGRLGLYYARNHFLHRVAKIFPPGSRLIEVGCGGGSMFLGERYEMLGVEIAHRSAMYATQAYSSVMQASSLRIPVDDNAADGLISSYVLEHLSDEVVLNCLKEMRRTLCSGGLMLHCFDVDADSAFTRWAKSKSWYDYIFVESKGHTGLRSEKKWRALFAEANFEVIAWHSFNKTWLQDLSIWSYFSDPRVTGWPRVIGGAAGFVRHHLGVVADVLTTTFQDIVEPWISDAKGSKAIVITRRID